ncbi:MAG: 4-(cytidine 5'-diphospho)-2-C-methyl-D-erythritol kinase [Phycisphaeraceae bacterium]|nr:4-(cytidine 5'-diphospho)-2-C-methyl-D-erythritol kinase [Phycisphaeraceae bacterium]
MTDESLTLSCPAKVNLALSIGAPLANGYHPIASWMVAVQFADLLTVSRSDAAASQFSIRFDAQAPVPGTVDWPLEKDLAYRALGLLEQHVGRNLRVKVDLQKRIPAGAGLGGGSSDAAGMLVGINRLFKLNLAPEVLQELAQKLGSDVAFLVGALAGRSSALVTGLGEMLAPLQLTDALHLVLIFPTFGCPTGEVYRAFDQLHRKGDLRIADEERVRALAAKQPLTSDAPFNDLAEPACMVRPALRQIVERIGTIARLPAHITGSGSTIYVLTSDESSAQAIAEKVTSTTNLAAIATRTL